MSRSISLLAKKYNVLLGRIRFWVLSRGSVSKTLAHDKETITVKKLYLYYLIYHQHDPVPSGDRSRAGSLQVQQTWIRIRILSRVQV